MAIGCESGLPAQGMPSETYASISIPEGLPAARQEVLNCKPVHLGGNPLDLHRELGYFGTHQTDVYPVVGSCPNGFHTSPLLLHVISPQGFTFNSRRLTELFTVQLEHQIGLISLSIFNSSQNLGKLLVSQTNFQQQDISQCIRKIFHINI